jgi:hypothetical protein
MFQHRSEGRNEILSKASGRTPSALRSSRSSCRPAFLLLSRWATESLQFKQMNDNQVRMLPPPERSLAVSFRRRAKTFAPIVAVALFVAGFLGSTDLQAATYVRVNIGGRPYYGYPYRYHGYYHYRGGRYRYRYYRYGHWHYY